MPKEKQFRHELPVEEGLRVRGHIVIAHRLDTNAVSEQRETPSKEALVRLNEHCCI